MTARDDIEERFAANLERVRNLLTLYEEATAAATAVGRRPVPTADLLRAAVVLLRATLEDLLRSLAELKLPLAEARSLEGIPLASGRKASFTLVELADFRGQTVDEVIAQSVVGHLDRSSYNHPGEVVEVLGKLGIKVGLSAKMKDELAAMMRRRHWIAHRADRNPESGPGHQSVQSISLAVLKKWSRSVGRLGELILAKV